MDITIRREFIVDDIRVYIASAKQDKKAFVLVSALVGPHYSELSSLTVEHKMKSLESAEHFVKGATDEVARRGYQKLCQDFGPLLALTQECLARSTTKSALIGLLK